MVKNEIVDVEEQDLYTYGLQQGFIMILNILTTIVIGLVFGMVWQSIIFMIVYIPIRTYAGGYHAETQLRCYWFSVLMISVVLALIRTLNWTSILVLMITVIAATIIFYFAPVADHNKPLDITEKRVYRKRTRILTVILLSLGVLFWIVGVREISVCIVCALATEAAMILLGTCKNKIQMIKE